MTMIDRDTTDLSCRHFRVNRLNTPHNHSPLPPPIFLSSLSNYANYSLEMENNYYTHPPLARNISSFARFLFHAPQIEGEIFDSFFSFFTFLLEKISITKEKISSVTTNLVSRQWRRRRRRKRRNLA